MKCRFVIVAFFINAMAYAQSKTIHDRFLANWICKDTGFNISKQFMSRIYLQDDKTWQMTKFNTELIPFIDTPTIATENVFESWGACTTTLVADLKSGAVEVSYTAIYCFYRLELLADNTLRLSYSKQYQVKQNDGSTPSFVPSAMKRKYNDDPGFEQSIILNRLAN